MVHIKKRVNILDNELVNAFKCQDSATVHEAMGQRGAMNPFIKPIEKKMRVCGPALTVTCHSADNIMLIKAINMAKRGDVIVANMGQIQNSGPFGEVLANECMAKGVAGLILTSSVRDSRQIIDLGFSVFCTNLCVCGTAKSTLGTINHVISCGDVIVHPGDLIIGDNDGVVVVPVEECSEVLEKAKARIQKEKTVMERLRKGESLFDIYGYQSVLDGLGCVEER